MPDYQMCSEEKCKSKKKCWRYMAKPCKWQAYGDPENFDGKKCDNFIKVLKNALRNKH